jgi:hypothetical protein
MMRIEQAANQQLTALTSATAKAEEVFVKNLTDYQKRLLAEIKANPGLTTAGLRRLRGDRQAYESNLRDRLFRLAEKGLLRYEEKNGRSAVIERRWF